MIDQTILITGGTGFAGSHLVEELLARGYSNIYVTNYGSEQTFVHQLLPADRIVGLNLTNLVETSQLIERLKPTWIFHLASIAVASNSFEKAAAVFQNNIALQLNLLEAVKEHSSQSRVLVVGSGMEYGMAHEQGPIKEDAELRPTNPYAVSKVTQDLLGLSYVYSYQLDVVRVRPFNHIGERQTTDFAIPSFAYQIALIERGKQDKIMVGNLDAVRDFSDVKDVVKAYILLLEKGKTGEVYNVGSGSGVKMVDVLNQMCQLSQTKIIVETEKSRLRPVDVPVAVGDISKMQALGWQPIIPLEETLKRVLNEWRTKENI